MLYSGTHDMPIYHYTKCLVNDELRYMVIGWNERDEVVLPKDTEEIWFDIFNSFCTKTSTNDTDTYYALINELDYLRRRYKMVEILVKELNENNRETYGYEISQWEFSILATPISEQKKHFEKQFRIANQDIELKQSEVDKWLEENDTGEPVKLYKKKIRLERITGLTIDIKTCVLDEWIEIISEADTINEEYSKAHANG